ncbi:MAG: ATP-binding cassette domain-containing protein [Chlorobaculum sp.]|jgi:ABC-type multidrug transport system ATPase subunit/SAM-dependent methyltransferase|nr:ATP-binding cassette domain-containing protein [Chlorobaculum sp.]
MMGQFTVTYSNFFFEYEIAGFGPVPALRGVSINGIRNGEIVCIVGPNASGKSTFLDLISERRKLRDKYGKIDVIIDGKESDYMSLVKVYVPQKPYEGLVPDLTIAENVVLKEFVCKKANLSAAINKERRLAILKKCNEYGLNDISHRLNMPPGTLSGGQQQLLNILSAIMAHPHLLILDEPTSKLDESNSLRVWDILCTAAREENIAIICVTHDMDIVPRIADRIVYFEDGNMTNEVLIRVPKDYRFIGEIRRVSRFSDLPNCFFRFRDDWWHPYGGGFFGNDYFDGDDSNEGYLIDQKIDRKQRTNREVSGLIRLLKIDEIKNIHILDAPCGWGRHAIELTKRGFCVTAIDANEGYVEKGKESARREDLSINWDVRDLRDLGIQDSCFDIIINMWTSFGFFGPGEDQKVLAEYARCLKSDGRILIHLDLNPIRVFKGIFDEPPIRSLKNGNNLEVREWYCDEDRAVYGLWKINVSDKENMYKIYIYGEKEWAGLAKQAGLEVEAIYGSFDEGAQIFSSKSQEFIVILKKK